MKGSVSCLAMGARAPVGEPVQGERLVDRGHDPRLDQRGGHMRPPDGPVPGDPRHLFPGDRHAQFPQPRHHGLRPGHPVVPHQFPLGEQRGLLRVEQVGQQVHGHPVDPTGHLGPGHEREPRGQGLDRLAVPPTGVVIGQRHDIQPSGGSIPHQLTGRVRTVRGRGVSVQIDTHAQTPTGDSTKKGPPRVTASLGPLRTRGAGPLRGAGLCQFAAPPGGRDQPRRRRTRPTTEPAAPPRRYGSSKRGESAPHGTRSTSAPASRKSVSTSSSYINNPDCSGHTTAHSHSPNASPRTRPGRPAP